MKYWPYSPLERFRKRGMRTFSQVLQEKLKKEDLRSKESVEETYQESFSQATESNLSQELLRWLNLSPLKTAPKKSYGKVEESSYSIYKKDPKVLEQVRLEKEKMELNAFLAQFSSEKEKVSVQFFYAQGARSFMSMSAADLKRDYKKLALKLHPDRHFNEIPSLQRQSEEDFRVLSESYDTLKMLFSRAK